MGRPKSAAAVATESLELVGGGHISIEAGGVPACEASASLVGALAEREQRRSGVACAADGSQGEDNLVRVGLLGDGVGFHSRIRPKRWTASPSQDACSTFSPNGVAIGPPNGCSLISTPIRLRGASRGYGIEVRDVAGEAPNTPMSCSPSDRSSTSTSPI
jgi:hypothetical protein